jgi:Beta-lactamase
MILFSKSKTSTNYFSKGTVICLLLAISLFQSCKSTIEDAAKLPTLTTIGLSDIASTSAVCSGKITDDGGGTIIAKGVVWSTSPNPTISLATKTNDGKGAGDFVSNLSGLTTATKYYLRAYATNSAGTTYGDEIAFQSLASLINLDNAINGKMKEYNIPSLSIAILKNEKLVYLKSYGFSDKEANKVASIDDLYRIASLSKPITAITILKLVQEGAITLDQKVFGVNGILGEDYGAVPAGSKKNLITVRHLLEHKSGWDNNPTDPLFANLNLTQEQMITNLLANRPLANAPGSTYNYLNFGYCVLGRIIEKVSKIKYDSYVSANILQPSGITAMKIGGNTLSDRYPNEVKYYQPGFDPYSLNIVRMDANAGWIASAKDLAKFIVRIDKNTSKPDIIKPNILNEIYFGDPDWQHYGSLSGNSSILKRIDDTFSFVVLTNTRTEPDAAITLDKINATVINQIKNVANWSTYDSF